MYLVAIAWIYVVLMMAVAEAISTQGSLMGALVTLLLYGALPLSVVLYVMGAPARGKARRAREQAVPGPGLPTADAESSASTLDPDGGGLPAGDAVAPERKEP